MICKMHMQCKKDFTQLFSDVQSFLSVLKDQIQLILRPVEPVISVWCEDLPVLDNSTQSPRFSVFAEFRK